MSRASVTRVNGAPLSTPPMDHIPPWWLSAHKVEPNPSICIGLACGVGRLIYTRACTIARGTCHVQPSGPQPAPSSFCRSGASNEHSPVPIGLAVRAPEAKSCSGSPDSFHLTTLVGDDVGRSLLVATYKAFFLAVEGVQRAAGNMITMFPLSVILPYFVCLINLKLHTILN